MLHMIWTSPLAILLALSLLIVNLGYSALAGFALFLTFGPLLSWAIKNQVLRRRAVTLLADQRLSLTYQIIHSIRFVKIFGWENGFLEQLRSMRSKEIRLLERLTINRCGINALSVFLPVFASMMSFITYSLSGHDLDAPLVFSSLALFNALRAPLNLLPVVLSHAVDGLNAVKRIQDFLLQPDIADTTTWDLQCLQAIVVSNASFVWTSSSERSDGSSTASRSTPAEAEVSSHAFGLDTIRDKLPLHLRDLGQDLQTRPNLHSMKLSSSPPTPPPGGFQTCGRSFEDSREVPFILNNLTFSIAKGELVGIIGGIRSGKSSLLSALAGEMTKVAGSVILGSTRSFCSDQAWLQNASIRENILFGKAMDENWYNLVLDACALQADLAMLPRGDATEIGERGVTLSGGQRQRINVARAVYQNTDLVLMDDPLSAVDTHVGHHMFDKALCGLLRNRCRVVTTHHTWVLEKCDRVIVMDKGSLQAFDTFLNLVNNSEQYRSLLLESTENAKLSTGQNRRWPLRSDSIIRERGSDQTTSSSQEPKHPATSLMQKEEYFSQPASWRVYFMYFGCFGSPYYPLVILACVVLAQGSAITTSLWLSWWSRNAFGYDRSQYIAVYISLGVSSVFFMFVLALLISSAALRASRRLADNALSHVFDAPISFFDTTPLGRITTLFAKDVDVLDNISESYRLALVSSSAIVSVFILSATLYPYFAIALGCMLLLSIWAAAFYRTSARQIKKFGIICQSTMLANFSEAITGSATIRAYGLETAFHTRTLQAVDKMNTANYLTVSTQRWLSVRLDAVGNLLLLIMGVLVVTSRLSMNPASGGLVLSYILSMVQLMQFAARQTADVENDMSR